MLPDPADGNTDSAKGFARAEEGWDTIRSWLLVKPQPWFTSMQAAISTVKDARR